MRRNAGAAARTAGAAEARTPFIAFCDDDCTWDDESLRRAVRILAANPDVALVNARVLVSGAGIDPACEQMRCGMKSASCVPITYFMAGACVMRASAFLQTGGYHARYLIGAEETLVALDLATNGWRLWYDDGVVVRHRPAEISRDSNDRKRLQLRNRLWTMLLRRSPAAVLRAISAYVRGGITDRMMRRALVEAIAGLPWILRERRPIPRELERRIQPFDHALIP